MDYSTSCTVDGGVIKRQKQNVIAKEIFRKSIHICSAFVPFLLHIAYVPVIVCLISAGVLYTAAEIVRLHGYEIPVISAVTAVAARKRDENKFVLGPVTLVIGIVAAALLWPPMEAAIGIYALSFGDGLASLSGKMFGKTQIPFTHGKTSVGSLTCFTAIFVVSFLVSQQALPSLIIASIGMFVELLPLKDFDNVFIPVILGGVAMNLLH